MNYRKNRDLLHYHYRLKKNPDERSVERKPTLYQYQKLSPTSSVKIEIFSKESVFASFRSDFSS